MQEHMGIKSPPIHVHIPNNLFITGYFNIPAKEYIRDPYKRVKTIYRQEDISQWFPNVIPVAKMRFFMGQNKFCVRRIQVRRQVDTGVYKPYNKCVANLVADAVIFFRKKRNPQLYTAGSG